MIVFSTYSFFCLCINHWFNSSQISLSLVLSSWLLQCWVSLFSTFCVFSALACCIASVQSLSRVRLFVTPWTAACQASLSITSSRRLLRLMSVESVMPSMSQFFTSGGQSIGASTSASVLPMDIQDWFPLGTGLISLQFKGLSRVVIQPLLYPYNCSFLGHSYLTTSFSRETLYLHIKSLLWEIVKTKNGKMREHIIEPSNK